MAILPVYQMERESTEERQKQNSFQILGFQIEWRT